MTAFEIKNIILLVVSLANLTLTIFTYLKNKKNKVNTVWGVVSLSVFLWTFSMFMFRTSGQEDSLLWCKILYITAVLIPSSLTVFAHIFPSDKFPLIGSKQFLIFFSTALIISLTAFDGYVVKDTAFYSGLEKKTFFGPLYPLYFIYISGMFLWSFLTLLKKYLNSSGILKNQLKYILIGIFSSVIFGTTCNLFFPAIGFFKFEWIGQTATIIFVSSMTVAITKYHLFDVKAILTECLVMAMGIILFILPFVINPAAEMKILMFAVFAIYCFIGYLLVRSISKEIGAKETFEQRVKDRTKELEAAYQELKSSNEELEKFYKLTIGRELRMAELKEKIKKLENTKDNS